MITNELEKRTKLLNSIRILEYLFHHHQINDKNWMKKFLSEDNGKFYHTLTYTAHSFALKMRPFIRVENGDDTVISGFLDAYKANSSKLDFIVVNKYYQLIKKQDYHLMKDLSQRYSFNNLDPRYLNRAERRDLKIYHSNKDRARLYNFIRSIAYLRGITLGSIARNLGCNTARLDEYILQKSDHEAYQKLSQISFIADEDIKQIIFRSEIPKDRRLNPCTETLRRINHNVSSRKSLKRYVYAMIYMYGMSPQKMSRLLGKSSNYIRMSLDTGAGEALAALFDQISRSLGIPNTYLFSALARSGVRSGNRPKKNRKTYFIIRYKNTPLKRRERYSWMFAKDYRRDLDYIRSGVINFSHGLINDILTNRNVMHIAMGLGHLFSFDGKQFIRDNIHNYTNLRPTYVYIDHHTHDLKKGADWLRVFHRLHRQLVKTDEASRLPELAKSPMAPYIYVGGINLGNPVIDDSTQRRFDRFSDHRFYKFTSRFEKIGLDINSKGGMKPMIKLSDVRYHNRSYHHRKGQDFHVTDNLWINYTSTIARLGVLQKGDLIQLDAKPRRVYVGYNSENSIKLLRYTFRYMRHARIYRHNKRDKDPLPTFSNPTLESHALTGYILGVNNYDFDYNSTNYKYARMCKMTFNKWKKMVQIKEIYH